MAATIEFRYTGGAANSDPDASLGGAMSSDQLSATALNNLFDNVSPAEASAGDTEYRAIDIYNSGDAEAQSVEIYMSSETSSADSQIDFYAPGGTHDGSDQSDAIADESTEPAGASWSHYTSASKLSLPNIASGAATRLWVRRVISASAGNTNNDSGTIAVDYA
jgi:hypothetical protein